MSFYRAPVVNPLEMLYVVLTLHSLDLPRNHRVCERMTMKFKQIQPGVHLHFH